MSTGNAVRRALYGKMSGDSTLRGLLGDPPTGYASAPTTGKAIYSDVAPAESETPFVVFSQTSGVPIDAIGPRVDGGTIPVASSRQTVENDLWTIKAVSRAGSPDEAEVVRDRLDVLLTNGAITIAGGGEQIYLRRESDVNYSEVQDGVTYFHRGCVFRLIWQ